MKLSIVTPLETIVEDEGVRSLRAEDASGGFGVLPGHVDFLTSLEISVVSWTRADGTQRYCAVRRGVLTVAAGSEISIATREAVPGDDAAKLADEALRRFRSEFETERTEHVESTRLQLNAIRQIMRHLRSGTNGDAGSFA